MGYTTQFYGEFNLDRPLEMARAAYLAKFADIRHMRRDTSKLGPDPIRAAVRLPVGVEGAFYIGSGDTYNDDDETGIIDCNYPPEGVPGLWCHWIPVTDEAGQVTTIQWDDGEKFYNYVEWLQFIVENFLKPWGYVLNGEVEYEGEDSDDAGKIIVKDNCVGVATYERVLGEVEWIDSTPTSPALPEAN